MVAQKDMIYWMATFVSLCAKKMRLELGDIANAKVVFSLLMENVMSALSTAIMMSLLKVANANSDIL